MTVPRTKRVDLPISWTESTPLPPLPPPSSRLRLVAESAANSAMTPRYHHAINQICVFASFKSLSNPFKSHKITINHNPKNKSHQVLVNHHVPMLPRCPRTSSSHSDATAPCPARARAACPPSRLTWQGLPSPTVYGGFDLINLWLIMVTINGYS